MRQVYTPPVAKIFAPGWRGWEGGWVGGGGCFLGVHAAAARLPEVGDVLQHYHVAGQGEV